MGRWGQGIWENDTAQDVLGITLAKLCKDLREDLNYSLNDNGYVEYPDSAVAYASIIHSISKDVRQANFCRCDAREWREKIEKILVRFGASNCGGDIDLGYEGAQQTLKLFDSLIQTAWQDCECSFSV